ncbi:hypothetical protein ACQEU6_01745 [Spirillospora sp. CA-108201]
MGLQQFLDSGRHGGTLITHSAEGARQAGDHQFGSVGAVHGHRLLVQRGQDVVGQAFVRARCLRPQYAEHSAASGGTQPGW